MVSDSISTSSSSTRRRDRLQAHNAYRNQSLRECQRLRLPSQLMTCSSSGKAAARAPMKLNGLPQERRRASNNRSLLISLEQDSNTSDISGERIHRRSKHTL